MEARGSNNDAENGYGHLSLLSLTVAYSKESTIILQKDVTEPHLTLGVCLNPTGDSSAQYQKLLEKSNRVATQVLTSNLSRGEAHMAYKTSWFPAMRYSLGVMSLTNNQLEHIQSHATGSFLSKMGVNRNFPMTLLSHVYNNTTSGKIICITIQNMQQEAGTESLILADPTINIPSSLWGGLLHCVTSFATIRFSFI